jgi:hypothetical protein
MRIDYRIRGCWMLPRVLENDLSRLGSKYWKSQTAPGGRAKMFMSVLTLLSLFIDQI